MIDIEWVLIGAGMRVIYTFAILSITVLAGCASAPAPQKIYIRGDNYCRIAKEITWSLSDTTPTIGEIRKHNAKHRMVCG